MGLGESLGSAKAAIKSVPSRVCTAFDGVLVRSGMKSQSRDLVHHHLVLLREQIFAVVPISLLQVFTLLIFFQVAPEDAGLQVMGLILAIIGLVMFLEGLRVAVMPLAELLGAELPKKVPVAVVLLVAFFLGVLVTYAEPAIAALRPLGELVDPEDAPYLYYIMNKEQEFLVLSIGMGVGLAAVLGTLRFIRNWPLKPMIIATLTPTLGLACYMQWGNTDLEPLLGMAWDCGAVTTGPVTVPILLALGIGVMQSQKAKKLATAALQSSVAANAGNALEGFGIVTLASLLPILAVELMSIIISLVHSYDEVLAYSVEHSSQSDEDSNAIDESPLKEVIFGLRSILPLIVALLLLIAIFLRKPPPKVSWWVSEPEPEPTKGSEAAADGLQRTTMNPIARTTMNPIARHTTYAVLERASMAIAAANYASDNTSQGTTDEDSIRAGVAYRTGTAFEGGEKSPFEDDTCHGGPKVIKEGKEGEDVEAGTAGADKPAAGKPGCFSKLLAGLRDNVHFVVAIVSAQIGMILFNIGLTYGFTALGNQTGTTLPAAYREVPWYDWSPKYGYAGGLILVIVVLFLLGVLATRAEPALLVLGRTVERLSQGAFTAKLLIGAVCVGVGVGLVAGSLKILYQLPLIYFILGKYAIAVSLTLVTADSITAVAWDSAGVTTGPVTVPFVLSIGIGFSKAVGSAEGFGMLTIMSVAPIISVLLVSHLRKPAKKISRSVSSSLHRVRSKGTKADSPTSAEPPIATSLSEGNAAFAARGPLPAADSFKTTDVGDGSGHSTASRLPPASSLGVALPAMDSVAEAMEDEVTAGGGDVEAGAGASKHT